MTSPPAGDPYQQQPAPVQDAGYQPYQPYQPAGYPGQPADPGNPYTAPTPYAGPGGPPSSMATPPSGTGRAIGWIGVGLLYVFAIWQLVIPTVSIFTRSMTSGNVLMGDELEWVGFENWAQMLPLVGGTLGFSMLAVAPVMLVALVLGMVIGTAMPAFSRTSTAVRVVVGVTGALFVPLGVGLSRWLSSDMLASPEVARSFLVVTITLAWLPLLTAVFATAFGAAFAPDRRRAVPLVGVVGLLAILPVALQLFDMPYMLFSGGPRDATTTPLLVVFQQGLIYYELGAGAAASALVFVVAAALGLLAVVLAIAMRARLVLLPPTDPQRPRSGLAGVVVAGVVLVLALVTVVPVLIAGTDLPEGSPSPLEIAFTTWSPVAVGTAVQVLVAVLGGAAIGWFAPLGRRSLWLLVPMAPWLFVSPDLMLINSYETLADAGLVNTWRGLVPSPTLVVGAVVLLALLFAGLRQQTSRPPVRVIIAAAAGLYGVLLLVQGQSLLRSLTLVTGPELATAPVIMTRVLGSFAGRPEDVPLGLLYPMPVLLLVVALGVVAQLGLRRVALVRE